MLFNASALTIHLVGHKTFTPGASEASSDLIFSKHLSHAGDFLINLLISCVISRASFMILYLFMVSAPVLQLSRVIQFIRVNWVTFCPGQLGLTRFIKYPGLTLIWHRITCIRKTSHGDNVLDDVSISCQYISKRVIVDGMEAPRKVTR